MFQATLVAFITAYALGSTVLHLLPKVTYGETVSSTVISPLGDEVLGITDESLEPSPVATSIASPDPDPTPSAKLKITPKPSPTPTPSPSPATGAQLDEWFAKYAAKESVNKEMLRNIAYCESKFNQFAKNGDYLGLYQFSSGTWVTTRRSMNQNPDPKLRTDAEETIKTAAFRLATISPAAWPNCSK